jgi:broad specificity phosphatase PhoE
VADRLTREFKVSAACSSDLKRAFETASREIAATCGIVEVYY